ncbi:nicotinate phosphoribosyltransferase [Galbitalea sp. SE-J8]|uniref:nicotinate phosphoribosyltransferase n=1 Tax=Galbitalea sp. SE-J8 TaxID=3054952 RepID=UPI00259C81D7|nr:nicotinate phosphoribosyltransferase [Galbitalea sp. SE-J8]MDM4763551.1 nicotinate phosphoribosyltransferase [Galbitalea sp. SE-J8]
MSEREPSAPTASTALLTDRYELTMVDAALKAGTAHRRSVFEVFGRSLPGERRFGVVAGTGRAIEAIEAFRFRDAELGWLSDNAVVSDATLDRLSRFRFNGDVRGYAEGELYVPGSPILQVEGTFLEACLLETVVLSILNHDSSVATAAARMVIAADGRPLAEMGSRRTDAASAVSAARAAYIAGFGATSNLLAGKRWGVPTMGTAAHAFTLLHGSEEEAFRAQVDAMGVGTTLLVDTYDVMEGVRTAVRVAGTGLGAVRLDSGDLPVLVGEVRALLDSLGATGTRITVTNDLDEFTIAALRAAPVDSFGVGTSVVGGSGHPASGFVYKLVAHTDAAGGWVDVAKRSAAKATVAGRKFPSRRLSASGVATAEVVARGALADGRPLHVPLMVAGQAVAAHLGAAGVARARAHHAAVLAELPPSALSLGRGEPAFPTLFA